MERKVIVGFWYIVDGPAGATVTRVGEVNPCCTVPEGGQGHFFASAPVVVVSDESITLSQVVNFKGAPVKRWLLGRGVNALPQGYLAAEFLESTGKEYIDTGYKPNSEFGVYFDVQEVTTPARNVWYCGAQVSGASLWLDSQERFAIRNGSGGYGAFWLEETKSEKNRVQAVANFYNDRLYGKVGEAKTHVAVPTQNLSFTLFRSHYARSGNFDPTAPLRMFAFKLTTGTELKIDFVPCVDANGVPCMFNKVSKQPFYNLGSGAFIVGLTLAQARKLGKLPAGGGTLKVSLPWDAQLDKKVDEALDIAKSKGWRIEIQYQEPDVTSAVYNKYAACKTRDDVLAVNADYLNDLTADGEWVYPMPEMTRFNNVGDWWTGFFYGSKLKKIKAVFPKCTYSQALIGAVRTIEEVDLEFPIATHVQATCRYSDNYKKVRIVAPNATVFSYNSMGGAKKFVDCEYYAPKATDITNLCNEATVLEEVKGEFGANAVTLTGAFSYCYKLRKFPTYYPKASTAANMFNKCEIPGEAAIAVLNSFPAYTSGSHPVTIGIHVDHQSDAEVLAAIENAEAKGWTVTAQWNGTATAQTASTWGLRRKPIYAKVRETDLPDGTTERVLDWGHYVTNWEENGYMEFASEEEAKEYFNIGD